jgi:hypothetical protein
MLWPLFLVGSAVVTFAAKRYGDMRPPTWHLADAAPYLRVPIVGPFAVGDELDVLFESVTGAIKTARIQVVGLPASSPNGLYTGVVKVGVGLTYPAGAMVEFGLANVAGVFKRVAA